MFNSGLMPVGVNPGLLGTGAKDRGCTAVSVPDYQSPNQIGHAGQLNARLSRGVHYLGSLGVGTHTIPIDYSQ